MEDKSWDNGYRMVVTCLKCKDVIFSYTIGQFVSCKCNSVYVDQTPFYARIGGDEETYKVENKKVIKD